VLWLLVSGLLLCSPLCTAVTVTDDAGHAVTLAQPAQRIVSLAPHITELLFAAGAGGSLAGASDYSDYPAAAARIPRVGGAGGLDLEAILALRPDLVVAWQSGNPAATVQRLRDLGLTVFESEPRRLEDIPRTIHRLAQLAGTLAQAQSALEDFNARFMTLRGQYGNRPVVSMFYQIWDRPLMTINGAHLANDVVELCGGRNVFGELGALAPQITLESVLARDPQVIVVAAESNDSIAGSAYWQRWPQLQAVRNGHVYALQRELLVRHTPRILDGAALLCERLEQARNNPRQGRFSSVAIPARQKQPP